MLFYWTEKKNIAKQQYLNFMVVIILFHDLLATWW